MNLVENFTLILADATEWVRIGESVILRSGRCLDRRELEDARLAGVQNSAKIRVLTVPAIPQPKREPLAKANQLVQLITEGSTGLTLNYGIYIKQGYEHDRRLLVHEFVHVAQFERLGGIEGFLREYLMECLRHGYHYSPLEQESDELSRTIVAGLQPAFARKPKT